MENRIDLIAGAVLFALGVLGVAVFIPIGIQEPNSVDFAALSPSYWPYIVATAICALGLALTITALVAKQADEPAPAASRSTWLALRPFAALGICFALYLGLEPLGFVLACAIGLAALMLLAGEFRIHFVLPVAIVVPLGLYLFFTKAASVPIPMGVLEPWLLRI